MLSRIIYNAVTLGQSLGLGQALLLHVRTNGVCPRSCQSGYSETVAMMIFGRRGFRDLERYISRVVANF